MHGRLHTCDLDIHNVHVTVMQYAMPTRALGSRQAPHDIEASLEASASKQIMSGCNHHQYKLSAVNLLTQHICRSASLRVHFVIRAKPLLHARSHQHHAV